MTWTSEGRKSHQEVKQSSMESIANPLGPNPHTSLDIRRNTLYTDRTLRNLDFSNPSLATLLLDFFHEPKEVLQLLSCGLEGRALREVPYISLCLSQRSALCLQDTKETIKISPTITNKLYLNSYQECSHPGQGRACCKQWHVTWNLYSKPS